MFENWYDTFQSHPQARRWLIFINAVLWALVFWVGLKIVLLLLNWGLAQSPPTSILSAPIKTDVPHVALANLHLFGKVTEAKPMSSAANSTFVLHGIFAQHDSARGLVILKDDKGNEAVFRVGDQLSDGSKVAAVYPGRVELERAGVRTQLILPKDNLGTSNASSDGVGANANSAPDPMTELRNSPNPPIQAFINTAINTNPVMFDAVKNQAVLNASPDAAKKALSAIQPVLENGEFAGVRVSGLDAAWLKRAGLGSDDVLVGVNGQTITSLTQAQHLALSLAQTGKATISVRRNGRIETITINGP